MITAVFTKNNDYAQVYGVWQWDYGQELRIQGLNLPAAVEIHFALQETGGEAVTRVGVTQDGITTVPIPDSMLEGAGNSKDYQIYAWVYLADQVSGETIKRIKIQVRARPMPEAFEAPEDGEIFRQAIEAVNEAAKRAEDAGKEAVSSAGEAREAATQAGKHLETVRGLADQAEINADTVAQDKQAVAGMLSQVQQAASEAALSAEAAKLSETAAGKAQEGAEAAEDGARQYAADTEADRQEVASARQAVQQMREDVAADKSEVEQTAAGFVDTARQAVSDVNAAGKAQVDAIKTAGQGASNAVETAKTTAVQAVTAEGDKQVQRVQEAAAGVEADREQINQNKADIAGLAEGITDLAPGIKITTTGTDITIKDAAEGRAFKGLRVFGRTDQKGTPSPETPQEMETAGESGSIEVLVAGSNLLKPNNYNVFCESPLEANTVVTLMTNGKASNGGNIKFIGTDDSNVWFSIDKGQTRVCKSIGSKPVKGFYDLLTQTSGLEYMLAVGDVKTYESYRTSQSLTLSTPNGLPGIPVSSGGNYTDAKGQQWVCDEIDLGRGKYVQRVAAESISGGWKLVDTSDVPGRFIQNNRVSNAYANGGKTALCTIAAWTNYGVSKGDNRYVFVVSGTAFYISPPSDVSMTADELNAKLNALKDPVVILGQLAAPIERGLTPEEIAAYKALRTYSPTTVVSNDAGCHMETTYIADTKTYIDNKFAALNKTILDAVGGT